jgi:hypothetical protein
VPAYQSNKRSGWRIKPAQLDLLGDYKSNVALYPPSRSISAPTSRSCWLCGARTTRSSCEAFKRDIPDAVVRFFDTGHFALETHAPEIAEAIRDFLPR